MRTLMTTALLVLALGALPIPSIEAQGLDTAALEAAVNHEMTRHRVPGAAIAIVKGDSVIYMKAFGVANLETREPVRPETLFPIGSLTKSLTSAALVSLAVSGQMRLDDAVGTYLPGLAGPIARLTAAQLLSHTAGLVDQVPVTDRSRDESALSQFPKTWTDAASFTEPGQIFSVSNSGYWLAGAIIESVASKPYADAMKSQVFDPLGMTSTSLRPTEAITWPFAQGYARERGGGLAIVRPLSSYPLFWPSGHVISSVRDLSRLMIAFLNQGQLEGKQVFDPKVIVAMTTPHAKVPTIPTGEYGYGLFLDTIRGVRVWQHGGQRPGYGATIRMAPDHRVGVVILANQTGGEMPETAMRALELMLPLKPLQPTVPPASLPTTPDDLRRHPGVYRNHTTEIEIISSDGRLLVKRGERTRPLIKRSEVRFDSDSLGWYVFSPARGDVTRYVSAANQSYGRVSSQPGGQSSSRNRRIAFAAQVDGRWDIYVVSASGGEPVRLTARVENERFPVWSPDGNRISFASAAAGGLWELWIIDAIGSNAARLATDVVLKGPRPWSPDGSRIAFESTRDGDSEIYTIRPDGTGLARLTTSAGDDGGPTWSPDGSRIAFVSTRDGNQEIYVMSADGTAPTRITNHAARDFHPAWSPDGSRIVFVSMRDGSRKLYLVRPDGSGLVQLTKESGNDEQPAWSPDASRIAFKSGGEGGSEIEVVQLTNGQRARLTRSPAFDGMLSWSKDGGLLAFVSGREGPEQLWVMGADGSGPRRLSTAQALDPTWSP